MNNHTSHRPVMIALQRRIRQYTEQKRKQPGMVVLTTFLYTALMEEMSDGTYTVPEHRFPNSTKFQGVIVMADTLGVLDKDEKYCIIELTKVVLP